MIAGRKLLLADDSAAIQKVIELTFADEGMQVFTVGNGRLALETLEQVAPDVVLADVFMPELSGLDLCRSIRQNKRFARTPVMLLVSSFEPFDEGEARRAGADDIVAKPFQSIRQLVSRVGLLLGKSESEGRPQGFSTLGLSTVEAETAPENVPEVIALESEEPPVTVLVEAPQMEVHEVSEARGASCSSDIELQTADTQPLERITGEPIEAEVEEWQLQDTVEIEPAVSEVSAEAIVEPSAETVEPDTAPFISDVTPVETAAQVMPGTFEYSAPPAAPTIDESLLDVEEEFIASETDDVVLDLEFENAIDEAPGELFAYSPVMEASAGEVDWQRLEGEGQPSVFVQQELVEEKIESSEAPQVLAAESDAPALASSSSEGLPADAIDAIARRVVEQMSEKVVREIAWEVVPELSELLIKQKLNDQR